MSLVCILRVFVCIYGVNIHFSSKFPLFSRGPELEIYVGVGTCGASDGGGGVELVAERDIGTGGIHWVALEKWPEMAVEWAVDDGEGGVSGT